MKFTLKLAFEVRRSRPVPCDRPHADDPPEQLPSCSDARVELARCGWDYESRSPTTAAKFGFSQPSAGRVDDQSGGTP